jgi:hypothetical protein
MCVATGSSWSSWNRSCRGTLQCTHQQCKLPLPPRQPTKMKRCRSSLSELAVQPLYSNQAAPARLSDRWELDDWAPAKGARCGGWVISCFQLRPQETSSQPVLKSCPWHTHRSTCDLTSVAALCTHVELGAGALVSGYDTDLVARAAFAAPLTPIYELCYSLRELGRHGPQGTTAGRNIESGRQYCKHKCNCPLVTCMCHVSSGGDTIAACNASVTLETPARNMRGPCDGLRGICDG